MMCKQTQREEANQAINAFLANGGKIIPCKTGRRNFKASDMNAAVRD